MAPAGAATTTTTTIAIAPPPPGQPSGGMETGIGLYTHDLDAEHAALKAAGVDVDAEVFRMGGPVPPMFWFRDPEGNRLMVIQPAEWDAGAMGLLRGRDDDGGTRYQLREKIFSVGDDLWIGTEHDDRAFKVNGKALRIRRTLVIESKNGDELFKIQTRAVSVRDTMKIERGGDTIATVKKALVGIRDRYHVDVDGGEDLRAQGNFVDHEFKIERDGKHVAEVSKRWFSIRDTYGIDVANGEDAAFVIAIVICIDELTRG